MKLQQLRFLSAIAKHNLNISAAAERLYTSQPGISKQIKLLEEELGIKLFHRNGKHLTQITKAGHNIISKADIILNEVANIKSIAQEAKDDFRGTLTLATTHTQARYVLPTAIRKFVAEFAEVKLNLIQGTPERIANMAVTGEADFAIATEAIASYSGLVMIPAYRWNRCLVVTPDHELTYAKQISLSALAEYPLVTYVKGLTGRDTMDAAFSTKGLEPTLAFTATDADVIKTYVRLGLGVGIIAQQAFEPEQDKDLVAIDISHLFADNTTQIGFRRGIYMRRYMRRFLSLFASHLTTDIIEQAERCQDSLALETLFADIEIPKLKTTAHKMKYLA